MPGDVKFSIIVSTWSSLGHHKKFVSEIFIKEHPAMKTILAIDLGKSKSVFCKMDTIELKPRFSTLATSPQKTSKSLHFDHFQQNREIPGYSSLHDSTNLIFLCTIW